MKKEEVIEKLNEVIKVRSDLQNEGIRAIKGIDYSNLKYEAVILQDASFCVAMNEAYITIAKYCKELVEQIE